MDETSESLPLYDELTGITVMPKESVRCGRFPVLVDCPTEKQELVSLESASLTSSVVDHKMDIEFTDITYKVMPQTIIPFGNYNKEPKILLDGVSGVVKSGELTAIMGPSGAGKSTLMNVLAGYKTKGQCGGEVKVNGQIRDLDNFRKMSCYIMQDDALLPQLTVMELMMVSANLKLAWKIPNSEKKEQVLNILQILGLENARSTRTSQLSGGQKKRLSIALELVYNPPIMFFDEPTSGLDSLSCLQCIKLLKSLAVNGKTIICTIHQPSAKLFEMFDRLYIVAGGNCIYRGPEPGLLYFFERHNLKLPEHHNPADFIIEVACGIYGEQNQKLSDSVKNGVCEEIEAMVKLAAIENAKKEAMAPSAKTPTKSQLQNQALKALSNHMSKSVESLAGSTYATGFSTQFWVLFVRTFKTILRDTTLTTLRFIAHFFVGIMIGALYLNIGNDATKIRSNVACIFFCMLFLMFTALMPTVMTFPIERNILIREHMNYWYSLRAYFFAKTLADTPFQIVFPVLYASIVYFMTDQPSDASRFFLFVLFCVLVSFCAQACGLLISAGTTLEAAVFLGPITAIPILLFSGFFLSFDNIPIYLQPLSYLSYVRYGFEGTMLVIYGMDRANLECENFPHNSTQPTQCAVFSNPEYTLQELNVENGVIWMDIIWLLCFFFVYRGLTYLVLKWQVKANK